jgi:hypothetical protein
VKTANEYRKYLARFDKFLGSKQKIDQNEVSTFLSSFNGTNKVAVAALKSRLEFSGLEFKYKGLHTDPCFLRPHKPILLNDRKKIDENLSLVSSKIRWRIALKLLYEIGGRI